MIIFKKGNLFDSHCQTLVNTVNCNGIMGKGIALQFKQRYPEMFNEYKRVCSGKSYKGIGKLETGGDLWLYSYIDLYKKQNILCFATKENWWNKSKLEYIERGLKTFTEYYKLNNENDYHGPSRYFYENLNITSIAWPKLGCTNGGLNWEYDVKPLMIKYLEDIDLINEIYE